MSNIVGEGAREAKIGDRVAVDFEESGETTPPVFRLEGSARVTASKRTAVVTGAAQGIGGETARLFKQRGWTVHALDRRPHPDPEIRSPLCDVASEAQLLACAEAIGEIDALIPCAGVNLRPTTTAPSN